MGSSASVWVLNVAIFLGAVPRQVGRLSVNRASMTGRGLRRSDGPRCCRFLASAPLAQKPAQDLPGRPEAGGGAYPRRNAPATL